MQSLLNQRAMKSFNFVSFGFVVMFVQGQNHNYLAETSLSLLSTLNISSKLQFLVCWDYGKISLLLLLKN